MAPLKLKTNNEPVLPPTFLLIALLMMVGIHFSVPFGDFFPIPWNLMGLIPLVIGIILNIKAGAQFQNVETTIKPFEKPTNLVTDGMFQFSRNPMYLGFVLLLVGVFLLLGSLAPIFVIPTFIIIIQTRYIRFEEQKLAETFGDEWESYLKKVRRWI